MQNPSAPQSEPGSYMSLKERVFKNVQAARVNDYIFKIVERAFEDALTMENVMLSRPERQRLLAQVLKLVLDDMLKKLGDCPVQNEIWS